MKLVSVYSIAFPYTALYILLEGRAKNESISHKEMPKWDDHVRFVDSRPYEAWYLIKDENNDNVGGAYLTKRNEVGISIFRKYRRNGYASQALALLRKKHKGKLYANINPKNRASIAFFKKHGFTPLQVTYVST